MSIESLGMLGRPDINAGIFGKTLEQKVTKTELNLQEVRGEPLRLETLRTTGQDNTNMEFIVDAEARRNQGPEIASTPSQTLKR